MVQDEDGYNDWLMILVNDWVMVDHYSIIYSTVMNWLLYYCHWLVMVNQPMIGNSE